MGSKGSGRFGTYKERPSVGTNTSGSSFSQAGRSCPSIIENIKLEDVATSEFFTKYNEVPAVGLDVQVRKKLHSGRLVVELVKTQEIIGNLPVQHSYLFTCISGGINYVGRIIASGLEPVEFIVVTLNAA